MLVRGIQTRVINGLNMKWICLILFVQLSVCSANVTDFVPDDEQPFMVMPKDVAPDEDNPWKYDGRTEDDYNVMMDLLGEFTKEYYEMHNLTYDVSGEMSAQVDDIMLTLSDVEMMLEHLRNRHKRNIVDFSLNETFMERQWPRHIYYSIDLPLYTDNEIMVIKNGFKVWEESTCLTFNYIEDNTLLQEHHMFVTKKPNGTFNYIDDRCSAYVGLDNYFNLTQPIFLGSYCFALVGTTVHEIGHTLGLFHEHQRQDRDEYVSISVDNIIPSMIAANFLKNAFATSLGTEYDYSSLMHYGAKDFTSNDLDTVTPLDSTLRSTIGQLSELSFLDAQIVNHAYCKGICSSAEPLACENGGYQDPMNCNRCRCPDFFTGDLCTEIKSGTDSCYPSNGVLPLLEDDSVHCVNTPNYYPDMEVQSTFKQADSCNWLIQVPEGCSTNLWIKDDGDWPFLIKFQTTPTCLDYIEVRPDGIEQTIGERLCGRSYDDFAYPEDAPLQSNASHIPVLFRSARKYITIPWYYQTGAMLCYQLDDASCLGHTTEYMSTEHTTEKMHTEYTTEAHDMTEQNVTGVSSDMMTMRPKCMLGTSLGDDMVVTYHVVAAVDGAQASDPGYLEFQIRRALCDQYPEESYDVAFSDTSLSDGAVEFDLMMRSDMSLDEIMDLIMTAGEYGPLTFMVSGITKTFSPMPPPPGEQITSTNLLIIVLSVVAAVIVIVVILIVVYLCCRQPKQAPMKVMPSPYLPNRAYMMQSPVYTNSLAQIDSGYNLGYTL